MCKYNYSTNKRLNKKEKSKFYVEPPLNSILIGLLLGDGHIQKIYKNGYSRFIYAQSSLRAPHYNYFKDILTLFYPYLSKDFILKEKSFLDKRTNKIYSSVSFATLSLPCFDFYHNLFYSSDASDNKFFKIVPDNLSDFFTPISLAY